MTKEEKKGVKVKVLGNEKTFKLLYSIMSEEAGWSKTCDVMEIDKVGCLVRTETRIGYNGGVSVSVSTEFIPGVKIKEENGIRELVKR